MGTGIIVPEGYPHAGEQLEEIISPDLMQKRVSEIGQEISVKYKGKVPIIIGVLNGAFLFMADLVRNLSIQFEVDFIKIDSYGDNTMSSGTVRLLKDFSADIAGRDVIIVSFVTWLYKPDVASQDLALDWVGFNIDDHYVVGYGLDLKQIYRGLPGIYAVNKGLKQK